MQKITPCLWFDDKAEEAAAFYVSLFENARVGKITRYDAHAAKAAGRPEGSVLTVEFTLEGQDYIALNGGPVFKFSEAVSLSVSCDDQAEVDRFWHALTGDGGQESVCGWLKDKYGFSWQIVPRRMHELLADADRSRAGRVMQAMLQMRRIVVADLEKAAEGG